jgi:hypothetical protein
MTREERKTGSRNTTSMVDSMLTGMKEEVVSCDTQVRRIKASDETSDE